MPAEKQVEAVAAKLKERNPGFEGKQTGNGHGGPDVVFVDLTNKYVSDLSPVRALPTLESLTWLPLLQGLPLRAIANDKCLFDNFGEATPTPTSRVRFSRF